MTSGLIFTLLLVALNKKIACVEKGLEIGGCTLRETREGLGTWPSPPALGKCAEEDKYIYIYIFIFFIYIFILFIYIYIYIFVFSVERIS